MPSYLVESFVPRSSLDTALEAGGRLRAACDELRRKGSSARYVRTTFVPEDETCFLLVDAASADDVREAARRAALTIDRVVETAGGEGDTAQPWRFPGPARRWTRPDAWSTPHH